MYFTDRGIEELGERRGEDQVTPGWLAARLQAFAGLHPESGVPGRRWPPGRPAPTTRTASCEQHVTWFAGGRVRRCATSWRSGWPQGTWEAGW